MGSAFMARSKASSRRVVMGRFRLRFCQSSHSRCLRVACNLTLNLSMAVGGLLDQCTYVRVKCGSNAGQGCYG